MPAVGGSASLAHVDTSLMSETERKAGRFMSVTERVAEECVLAAGIRKGHCTWCGRELAGRQRRWCSEIHEWSFGVNHAFGRGSSALKLAVGHCVLCGKYLDHEPDVQRTRYHNPRYPGHVRVSNPDYLNLEADHIERANGSHGVFGCQHHWSNLRVLCHECHIGVTTEQRRDDAAARARVMKGFARPGPAFRFQVRMALAHQRSLARGYQYLRRFPQGKRGDTGGDQQVLALD